MRGVDFHCNQPIFVSGGDDYKIKVLEAKSCGHGWIIGVVCCDVGVELQTEAMPIHLIRSSGLHPHLLLSQGWVSGDSVVVVWVQSNEVCV